jgi:hypothetical protein
MALSLERAARALRDALVGFEPELLSGSDCASLAEELATTEKACAAARARAAARAADCGAHRARGFRDAHEWAARMAGSSAPEAKAALETAAALERCPETKEALIRGELSLGQAREITRTEATRPGSEAELVEAAKRESHHSFRERARKRRLEPVDPEDLHRRQQAAQEFRHWRDDLGLVRFCGGLVPEVGIPFINRLDAETDRLARQARKEGRQVSREVLAAEAFASIVEGGGKGKARSADLVVVCDLGAFRRGHAHPGEPCHVVGGGPIPVSVAREIGTDAFVKAVLHDGVCIETVVHHGRHIPAELRTALELGSPPDFEGVSCSEIGCERRYRLEWDHVDPRANRGPTSYDNLQARCWPHHREKTERDRAAGLLSGNGNREERAPP